MARQSSRARFAYLQRAFLGSHSPIFNRLAQLSVLYEDLRIETFAISSSGKELERLDDLSTRYRIHYFLRRSVATLLEVGGALGQLIRLAEYIEETMAQKVTRREILVLKGSHVLMISFKRATPPLSRFGTNVGGHFQHRAAEFATSNFQSGVVGELEITFHPFGDGGGAKLHFAGEIAALAFTKSLPGLRASEQETEDLIILIKDVNVAFRS